MRLVVPTAKFYAEKCKGKKDITFEDLIQEGMFGLMRATEKFDPHRGYKFSTYASRWIRQKISRYILNKGNTVRVPIYEQELLQERAKENNTIFSTQQLRNMQLAHNAIHVLELDHPLEEGSTETLAEVIADSTSETWQSIFSDFTQEEIQSLFERVLTSKEEIILKLYFGFGGAEPLTSEAIGERYGVTKQMINFFKLRALQKLRDHLDTQDYTIESFT